jgi:hypothetical protein
VRKEALAAVGGAGKIHAPQPWRKKIQRSSVVERSAVNLFSAIFANSTRLRGQQCAAAFSIGKVAFRVALNHLISRSLKNAGAVSHGSDNGLARRLSMIDRNVAESGNVVTFRAVS